MTESFFKNPNGIFAFPNPASDQQTLIIEPEKSQKLKIGLFDLSGKKVLQIFSGSLSETRQRFAVDLSGLQSAGFISTTLNLAMKSGI